MKLKGLALFVLAFTCQLNLFAQLPVEWSRIIPWSSNLVFESNTQTGADSWWVYRNDSLRVNRLDDLGNFDPSQQNVLGYYPSRVEIRNGEHFGGATNSYFSKTYGPDSLGWLDSLPISSGIFLRDMKVSDDERIYATGELDVSRNGFVAAFDSSGQFLWMDSTSTNGTWKGQRLLAESDGVIMAGYRNDSAGARRLLLIKFDLAGNRVFQDSSVLVPSQPNVNTVDIHRMSDNSISVTGNRVFIDVAFAWAARYSPQGANLWANFDIGLTPYIFDNFRSFPLSGDRLLMCGTSGDPFGAQSRVDFYALELRPNGLVIRNHFWGDPGIQEFLTGVELSPDSILYLYGGATFNAKPRLVAFDQRAQNTMFTQEVGDTTGIAGQLRIGQSNTMYVSMLDAGFMNYSMHKLNIPVGIDQKEAPLEMSVWPNPARDFLQVQTQETGEWTSEIWDIQGRLIKSLPPQKGKSLRLSIQGLTGGTYFLRLQNQNGRTGVSKFVVMPE